MSRKIVIINLSLRLSNLSMKLINFYQASNNNVATGGVKDSDIDPKGLNMQLMK